MIRIVFLCTGNTCRSPMAEAICKAELKKRGLDNKLRVSSAGLSARAGDPINPNSRVALKGLGISGVRHKSRCYEPQKNDLVIAMTEAHLLRLPIGINATTVARLTGGAEVVDPYGCSVEAYKATATYLSYAMPDIIDYALEQCGEKK